MMEASPRAMEMSHACRANRPIYEFERVLSLGVLVVSVRSLDTTTIGECVSFIVTTGSA